ncbi:DUF4249 domain-containing protein [Pontibacter sp. KCTC 32443]|uniref:DUF4249 domain-containing protein n=1 Tax=Pontibacter TaxID=323449 RepID=UPI00164E1BDB|nr:MULTISPECIES: DUF4249 domain-containing protein [Pontibacter]MBC5772482.1 DUF4249 domain-containing protein [Pontibacter sp. KCTC 32443]
MKRILYLYLLPLFFILGCNMEKEIEVVLPEHEPQLVVECYLEQGYPFQVTVLETSSYFDSPTPPLVPDAEVYITFRDRRIKLTYNPAFNARNNRYFTHSSTEIMDGAPGEVYGIEVVDGQGRKVTGFTTILPKVPIIKVEWKFNEKDKAYVLTTFQDDPNTANFYRYMTHRDSLENGAQREFVTSDELTNGKETSYGSGYDYEEGDTLILSLYHIEEQYYDFLRSTEDAKNANGNPFAQPSKIKSSVQGGLGIFTNLAFDRDTVILKK